jgi:biopolymer transport protein ExbD
MKETRRMRRMARNRKKVPGLNLTSLMDVFTILVFFLLANSESNQVVTPPKQIELPSSIVESKPRETVVIIIGADQVVVQGEAIIETRDLIETKEGFIPEISEQLALLGSSVIGISAKTVSDSQEVTILADKTIPFNVLKKVMSTCTLSGYGKISLAVLQKSAQI